MTYTYNSATRTLTIGCTGTGGFTADNLNIIKGTGGFYEVRHNGIKVTDSDTNQYTTSSCSTWTFSPTTHTVFTNNSNKFRDSILVFAGLLEILILAFFGITLIRMYKKDELDITILKNAAIGFVILQLILLTGIVLVTTFGEVVL